RYATGPDLFPGAVPRPEFLPQLRIGQPRRPELGLQPHEARGEVGLIEAPRLRPFLREPARAAVHLLLAREQLAVRLVEHGDDELVLGAEVVIDERVVHAGVPGDLPGAERGIALLGQPAV